MIPTLRSLLISILLYSAAAKLIYPSSSVVQSQAWLVHLIGVIEIAAACAIAGRSWFAPCAVVTVGFWVAMFAVMFQPAVDCGCLGSLWVSARARLVAASAGACVGTSLVVRVVHSKKDRINRDRAAAPIVDAATDLADLVR